MDKDILSRLYESCFDSEPTEIVKLPASGSPRRYFRLIGSPDVIGVVGDNENENNSFTGLANLFRHYGANVPEVFAATPSNGAYLQQDLGDASLFEIISQGDNAQVENLTRDAFRELVKIQRVPSADFAPLCYAESFGRRRVMWDFYYFKYNFLKLAIADFDESRLEDDFEALAERLLECGKETAGFMYRDFQSRNVMVMEGKPWLIDFQGGSHGPGIYDAVSFLWQAKAAFSKDFREKILRFYAGLRGVDEEIILESGRLYALFRTLQVLGAYGFRGLMEKKAHFLTSIPAALANLSELLEDGVLEPYAELRKVCAELVALPRFKKSDNKDGLTVTVFSFSYKKGYPEDLSGNGGGFMFDCRAMHNPGRYSEYKRLTGRDDAVIEFLEERGEVQEFLASAGELVFKAVERYLSRGFTSLQVGFGCTGGQHRSVYCAEAMAREIKNRFPAAHVKLIHREQNIEEML